MRIVLVDPSRTTRLIVTHMLEARGHDVLPFANELDALAIIKAVKRCARRGIGSTMLRCVHG